MNIPSIGLVSSTGHIKDFVASIDHPVDDLIVIFDGCRKTEVPPNPMVGKLKIVEIPERIGHAACWNLTIKCKMNSPNWLLTADGVQLEPGVLGDFAGVLERDPSPGLVHASSGDFAAGCWDLFLMSDDIVGIMGLFDENLPEWEFAGADYLMRTIHRPIKKVTSLNHGYGRAPAPYDEANAVRQYDYLTSKWGNWTGCNPHHNPFGNPYFAVDYFPFVIGS